MKITVLGCGPAGLLAAHTARTYGAEVRVFSMMPRPSYIAGAQFLHSEVPGLSVPFHTVRIEKMGDREEYARKVYGNPRASVSWDRYVEAEYPAWNLRALYTSLWNIWGSSVVPTAVTPAIAKRLAKTGIMYIPNEGLGYTIWEADTVISTIPMKSICQQGEGLSMQPHQFIEQTVHIVQKENDYYHGPENLIVYNGEKEPAWYRRSYLFGCTAYEWPERIKPPVDGVVKIRKPLATNCDCFDVTEASFLRVGRYGAWNKDSLVHNVVGVVEDLMEEGL